jgi:CubicO group peptidase (beta-lactamase class C family)
MLNGGEWNGTRLFPAEVVASRSALAVTGRSSAPASRPSAPAAIPASGGCFHNDHGAYAARGVHGQTIYVDPKAEMVLVRLASFPRAQNGFIDPTSLPAYQAVAEY